MTANVYNQKGEVVGEIKLPKEIFEAKVNSDLMHQVLTSQMANQRRVIAHTKTRGEVSGGGIKPWRQKGTGRARHGSIRSPLWKGGGVTFGPRSERNYKKRIPEKIRRKALFMAFSAKAKDNLILVLDKIEIENPKTKLMVEILGNLRSKVKNFKKGNVILALPQKDEKIILASRNLPGFSTIEARNLNVLDLLSFKYLILPKASVKVIKETFLKSKEDKEDKE